MKRRDFFKRSAIGAGAIALLPSMIIPDEEKGASYVKKYPYTYDEAFHRAFTYPNFGFKVTKSSYINFRIDFITEDPSIPAEWTDYNGKPINGPTIVRSTRYTHEPPTVSDIKEAFIRFKRDVKLLNGDSRDISLGLNLADVTEFIPLHA